MIKKYISFFSCFCFFTLKFTFAQVTFKSVYGDGSATGHNGLQCADGSYLVTGIVSDLTSANAYLVHTGANGDLIWAKTFGGSGDDVGHCSVQTSDGFLMVGSTTSFGTGQEDVYLLRLDTNGDTLWTRTYGTIHHDIGLSVVHDVNGGFLITASQREDGITGYNMCLIYIDEEGGVVWTRTFQTAVTSFSRSSVVQLADRSFVIAGSDKLIRIDVQGTLIWSKDLIMSCYGLSLCSNGDMLLCGQQDLNMFLWRLNQDGVRLWSKYFPRGTAQGFASAVTERSNGAIAMTGYSYIVGSNSTSMYMMLIEPDGDLQLAKVIMTGVYVPTYYIGETDDGFVVMGTGEGFSSQKISIVRADYELNACNQSAATNLYGANYYLGVNDVSLVVSSNIGFTSRTNTISGTLNESNQVCFYQENAGLEDGQQEKMNIYPNPVSDLLHISVDNSEGISQVCLIDGAGRRVLETEFSGTLFELDLSDFETGFFYVTVSSSGGDTMVRKMSHVQY